MPLDLPFSATPGTSVQNVVRGARSIKVDNPGGQWLHFIRPDGRYIAPYTTGVVIALPGPSDLAWFDTTPPAGQQNTGTGNPATIVYTSDVLPDSPGQPALPSPTAGIQVPVSGVITGTGASVNTLTVNIPAGTWRLKSLTVVVVASAASGNNPYYATITLPGTTTPSLYVGGQSNPPTSPVVADFADGLQFTSDGSNSAAGNLVAVFTAFGGAGLWTGNRLMLAAVLLPVAY